MKLNATVPSAKVREGEIPPDGIIALLAEIEATRATGRLTFVAPEAEGEVRLERGQIASEQHELPDGRDPVEVLLGLRRGRYEVRQSLPPLPVSHGDSLTRHGSLEVHAPADLMRFCERAGLTGLLTLEHGARAAEIVYDGGDIVAIRVQGEAGGDLAEVFGWADGKFRIETRREPVRLEGMESDAPVVAPDAAPSGDEALLRVVEVALEKILVEREKHRPAGRTSPGEEEAPARRRHPSVPPPSDGTEPRERLDKIRVIYLKAAPGEARDADPSTRHLTTDVTGEVVLPEARRGTPTPRGIALASPGEGAERGAPKGGGAEGSGGGGEGEAPSPLIGVAWAIAVLLISLAAIALLARLPPLE